MVMIEKSPFFVEVHTEIFMGEIYGIWVLLQYNPVGVSGVGGCS